MSSTRRLNVEVYGNAANFIAMMNRATSGVTRFGSGLGQMNREAQQGSRYLQAMNTTLRYAFAGRVIFGIQNAVQNLGEFKSRLGEIDSLAAQFQRNGKLQGIGSELDQVGKDALLMSNRFGIAVGDVETYMQRFFSSFNPAGNSQQRVKEMEAYTNSVLNLAAAIGSEAGDPGKLGGGLTGLINAIPGGRKHPGRAANTVANYFAAVLRQTPGLTGADIATAAGRFSSAKSLANMSVKDILSVFGVASQTGGSPAVIIRGITQLLGQSLLHPTRDQSLQVYRAAGLPTDPNALAKVGGTKVLEQLIQYIAPNGVNLSADQRNKLANGGNIKSLLGGQINLDAIYNAFSRQESVRQFVNLIANGGIPAIREFNKQLTKANKEGLVAQMASIKLRQSLLLRMRNAGTNAGIALAAGADWPLENLVARPTIYASNLAIRHPNATQAVVGGTLALGAANALRRMGALGRFGRLGGFIKGASAAEQAFIGGAIAKEELPAAISGGATDGTRGNPFWVIISPLSWQMGGPMGGSGGGGGGGTGLVGLGGLTKNPWVRRAGFVGAVLTVDQVLRAAFPGVKKFEDGGPSWGDIGHGLASGSHLTWGGLRKRGFTQNQVLTMLRGTPANERGPLLNALEAAHAKPGQFVRVEFEGNPKADLTVKLVDSQGHTLSIQEHKGVPIVPKAKKFPTSQGKAGSRKASKQ